MSSFDCPNPDVPALLSPVHYLLLFDDKVAKSTLWGSCRYDKTEPNRENDPQGDGSCGQPAWRTQTNMNASNPVRPTTKKIFKYLNIS